MKGKLYLINMILQQQSNIVNAVRVQLIFLLRFINLERNNKA